MTRILLTFTALAATLTSAESACAEQPAVRQPLAFGPSGATGATIKGFTRKGQEGIGLFGPAGGIRARPSRTQAARTQATRTQAKQAHAMQAQQFSGVRSQAPLAWGLSGGGVFMAPANSSAYVPRLQTNLQFPHLQVPYRTQGYVDIEYDDGTTGSVLMGNPANSFVPAGAFGFGPGAIYGW